jgi:hypothetical protein
MVLSLAGVEPRSLEKAGMPSHLISIAVCGNDRQWNYDSELSNRLGIFDPSNMRLALTLAT